MFRGFITALLIISLFSGIVTDVALAENDVVKIGVLANRSFEHCREKWTPTADYLTRVIQGKKFIIELVDFEQVYAVVEKGDVDFILSNPSFYVKLESWYGVSRIATLKNKVLDGIYTQFGGVVFSKKQREDIRQYSDLKGKTFMAVEETSFGGWRMAWREFKRAGIDPFKDFASLSFGVTYDAVVYAVRDGKVDAGTVRTDTLEHMQAEGKIKIDDFKVIHEHGGGKVHLPFVHSTRTYPEWPMAKVKHTPDELAEKVAVALMTMPADSPAALASESAGWTIPLNYQSVHECLKELKVGPYKDFGKIKPKAVLKKYWLLILINFATLIILAWFLSARIKLSRKLKAAHGELQSEVDEHKRSEERVRHLNSVLRTIRNINQLIVTEKDRERLIQRVCANFTATRGYHNAWIALFDESGNFISAAEEGVGKRFSQLPEIFKGGDLVTCGRKALGQPGVSVIDNPVGVCTDCPLTKNCAGRAAMSTRLEHEGKVYGIITVSVLSQMATDREELALFNEVAGDIAFALHSIEGEKSKREAEEALGESEENYRNLVESSTDAILMLDVERKIVSCNQAFLDQFGYERNEIKGRSTRIIHKSDESFRSFGEKTYPAIESSDSYRTEWEFMRKDGSDFPVETITSVIRSSDGRTRGYVGVMRDFSERKHAFEEKKKLEAQLQQAQKMEAIGTLAGGVAHDFNNLLTSILGNAELALMDLGKDNPLYESLKEIIKAGNSAASLTRQLLAFSRKQILQPVVLNLNTVTADIDKMLRRMIGEDIELKTLLEPDLGNVTSDPGQIEQVLINLAVNARDAMPQGGKLTIETANVDLEEDYFVNHGVIAVPGPYVMLAVTDTGCGMDKETQSRIFEPFFTTKEKGKGTGLGLSTVYGIVKQSNGFVWAYSEPGRGTTFKIYLSRVEGEEVLLKKEKGPTDKLKGSEAVLIVEDDAALRNLAQKTLHLYGYSVLEAENGEEALRVSKEHEGPIHLMITDVVMPKMGGKETAERLQPLYPQMKVIYMSGYTDNAIAHHGVLEPGLNFLEKPFTPQGLVRRVREVLDE